MNINWAAPTIDIFLFMDYPPMNINWAAPTIDIFLFVDYPPIINILDYPPKTVLLRTTSCTHSYLSRIPQCI